MSYRHSGRATDDGRNLIPDHRTGIRLTVADSVDYQDRYRGAMVGTGIGDALGRAVEGRPPTLIRTTYGRLTDFVPWRGWVSGPKGTLTDDTEMALCLAQSFVDCRGVDPDDLASRVRAWGRVGRGMGSATRAACRRLSDGMEWNEAGSHSAGNGAAMRAAPIGLLHPTDLDSLRETAAIASVITHNDPTAVASAIVMAYTVAFLVHTPTGSFDQDALLAGIGAALAGVADPALPERRDPSSMVTLGDRIREVFAMTGRPLEEVFASTHNGAFVLESLPAALAAFLQSPENPEEVILAAVNGGYDADTVGAMAGAFAGAYHGASTFRTGWLSELEFRSGIEGVADDLCHLAGLGPERTEPDRPASDEYAPFIAEGKRWITTTHHEAARQQPDEANDIRLMPHPTAARSLIR